MSTSNTDKKVEVMADILKLVLFAIDIAPTAIRKFEELMDKLDKDDTTQSDIDKVNTEIAENVTKILARKKVD